MRWIGRKLTLDRVLQGWLRQQAAPVPDDAVAGAHDRLMQAVLHTPQEPALVPMPRPRRPRFLFPEPGLVPAAALSVAMLVFGVWLGPMEETALSQGGQVYAAAQVANETTGVVDQKVDQKIAVLAMASPWGDWIDEGD